MDCGAAIIATVGIGREVLRLCKGVEIVNTPSQIDAVEGLGIVHAAVFMDFKIARWLLVSVEIVTVHVNLLLLGKPSNSCFYCTWDGSQWHTYCGCGMYAMSTNSH